MTDLTKPDLKLPMIRIEYFSGSEIGTVLVNPLTISGLYPYSGGQFPVGTIELGIPGGGLWVTPKSARWLMENVVEVMND